MVIDCATGVKLSETGEILHEIASDHSYYPLQKLPLLSAVSKSQTANTLGPQVGHQECREVAL